MDKRMDGYSTVSVFDLFQGRIMNVWLVTLSATCRHGVSEVNVSLIDSNSF